MDSTKFDSGNKELLTYLQHSGFIKSESVVRAFRDVPRHLFMPPECKEFAYEDIALPIGKGATISQPSTVATMVELLQPKKGEKILEIGTGSGWEACLLSKCAGEGGMVVTIEIDPEISKAAEANMARVRHGHIRTVVGDGSLGCNDSAPYDKIIYAAATPEVPMQVLLQLKLHGRAVAPIGSKTMQVLTAIDKVSEKGIDEHRYGTYKFLPLRGQLGF
jgi:protein-L-isoaspartate(D-aspartate) O-methyltransferase